MAVAIFLFVVVVCIAGALSTLGGYDGSRGATLALLGLGSVIVFVVVVAVAAIVRYRRRLAALPIDAMAGGVKAGRAIKKAANAAAGNIRDRVRERLGDDDPPAPGDR